LTAKRELANLDEEEVDYIGRNRFRCDEVEVEVPLTSLKVESEETFRVERLQELPTVNRF